MFHSYNLLNHPDVDKKQDQMSIAPTWYQLGSFSQLEYQGPWALFLAPAEGCFGGPLARHLGIWPNNLFQPPKDHILKVLWHYLHFCLKYKHLKNQGYKQGYAQWVIHEILDVLCRHQGSYPESFVALSSFLSEI